MSMTEGAWNTMMGLSKVFMRRLVLGVILTLIFAVALISTLYVSEHRERVNAEQNCSTRIEGLMLRYENDKEAKNEAYLKLLRELFDKADKLEEKANLKK